MLGSDSKGRCLHQVNTTSITDDRVAQLLPVNIMALVFQSFRVRLPLITFYHLSRVTALSVCVCPKDTESCFISY